MCFSFHINRGLLRESVTETASPPSDVSLYFEFISFAVSAIAATVVSKSTRRFAGISLLAIMNPGSTTTGAIGAALDAGHLDEPGDRIAGQPQVMLQGRLRGIGDDLRIEVVGLGDQRGAHRGCDTDLRLAAALGARQGRVVLAQVADHCAGQEAFPNLLLRHLPAALAQDVDQRGDHPAEPPVGAVTTRWPRAFSSEPANA